MHGLFDALKERQLGSGRGFEGGFPGLGERASELSPESWFDQVWNRQALGNIYPWMGETVGVKFRLCRGEVERDKEDLDGWENSDEEDWDDEDLDDDGSDEEENEETGDENDATIYPPRECGGQGTLTLERMKDLNAGPQV
ncbi:hypothetical protein FA15DRAFT_674699, partial [Coprinopsis marcescibilis]